MSVKVGHMTEQVTIFEMGPRDGLQNEKRLISTDDKVRLVDRLSDCGLTKIEVTSFVSPKWVPQMADAADVMAGIHRARDVIYSALTPNMRGLEAALEAKSDEVAVFASASEGFSQANINCSIDESLARFAPVMEAAKSVGTPVRGYVSCVIACPYDGVVAPEQVAYVTAQLLDMGCYEVSLGDTIGVGTPESVTSLLDVLCDRFAADQLAGHFHDTNGQARDNIKVALDYGLRTFDAAVAGLGGCPYAPGAKGNVATEQVVAMLHDMVFDTGVDLDRLTEVADFARGLVINDL